MRLESKYNGNCADCKQPYAVGDQIEWERGSATICAACADRGGTIQEMLEAECLADRLGFSLPGDWSPGDYQKSIHGLRLSSDATTTKPKRKSKPPSLF